MKEQHNPSPDGLVTACPVADYEERAITEGEQIQNTHKTQPLTKTPAVRPEIVEELHITVRWYYLATIVEELNDWFEHYHCALIIAQGEAYKSRESFIVVRWNGEVPETFKQKLYHDEDVFDFRIYPAALFFNPDRV